MDLAVPGLLVALGNPNPAVRQEAARALGSREGSLAAFPQLMKALEDSEPSVRVNAAHALAKSGSPKVAPALQQAMESDSLNRLLMAGALREAPDPSGESSSEKPSKE